MSERYGGSRPPRSYDDRPRSSGQRPAGAGYNTNSAHRSTAGRPAPRPAQGTRPVSRPPQNARPGTRPPQNGRRPAPKRKKKSAAPTIILIVVIIAVIIGGIIIIPKLVGNNMQDISNTNQGAVTTVTQQPVVETTAVPNDQASLADYLNDEDVEVQGLTKDQMVDVTHLSINENLPEEWLNVLLLGTDERNPNESSRSDTMMICSVNKNTGEVKLTSIMRDLAVDFNDLGKNSGTYRINSANYFGGPEYAMKTVNECFDMNIQYYVSINFFGFQDIAHALGGITVDITQEEMVEINRYVWNAHVAAEKSGVEDTNRIPLVELTTYGEGTQLDGRQTLSYARIRKLDNDYARANRQRETLGKLADKLKQKSPAEITLLMANFTKYIKTNMEFNEAASIAMKVLQGDMSNIEGFRLPVERTYEAKTINNKSMLYDCDWAANARDLYTFIYS